MATSMCPGVTRADSRISLLCSPQAGHSLEQEGVDHAQKDQRERRLDQQKYNGGSAGSQWFFRSVDVTGESFEATSERRVGA
ncbi:MAG TPA: hypothetical protein VGF67_00255 [Ktedonobacteraceae bacterium]|jgi:hypothetical protein